MALHSPLIVEVARRNLDHVPVVVPKPSANGAVPIRGRGIAVEMAAEAVEVDADALVRP